MRRIRREGDVLRYRCTACDRVTRIPTPIGSVRD